MARRMDRPSEQLLARAGLAHQQDVRAASAGNPTGHLDRRSKRVAFTDEG